MNKEIYIRKVEPKRWRAEYGVEYFYVDSYGAASPHIERNTAGDSVRYEVGNYYERKLDALRAAVALPDFFKQFHEVKA